MGKSSKKGKKAEKNTAEADKGKGIEVESTDGTNDEEPQLAPDEVMVAVKYLETDLTFSINQKKASTAANAAKRASQLLGRMTGLDPGCFIRFTDEAEDGALGDWVDKHNCAPILYMTTSRGKGLLAKAQATSEVALQAMQDHENNLSSQLKLKDEHVEKRLKKMQLEIEVLEREKKILALKLKIVKNREVEAGLTKKNMEAGLLASESANRQTLKLEKEKYQTLESNFKEMEAEADSKKEL